MAFGALDLVDCTRILDHVKDTKKRFLEKRRADNAMILPFMLNEPEPHIDARIQYLESRICELEKCNGSIAKRDRIIAYEQECRNKINSAFGLDTEKILEAERKVLTKRYPEAGPLEKKLAKLKRSSFEALRKSDQATMKYKKGDSKAKAAHVKMVAKVQRLVEKNNKEIENINNALSKLGLYNDTLRTLEYLKDTIMFGRTWKLFDLGTDM